MASPSANPSNKYKWLGIMREPRPSMNAEYTTQNKSPTLLRELEGMKI
jgi:hypothetical protein